MTIWRPDLAGRTGPKFRQIADAIGEAVAAGRLPRGARLPPQRELAYGLGVSLNTVSRAYADATERGFVAGEVGRGTYVREAGPLPPPEAEIASLARPLAGPIDFALNLPAPGEAAACLAETLRDLSGSNCLAALLDYQTEGALDHHAAAAADWLRRVGLASRGEEIVLATGAQHAILAALMATTRPGDVILSEALTYAPIKAIAHHLGLRLVPLAGGDGPLGPDALEAACARFSAKLLYCLPTLHTPTTRTMDAERRAAIADVARRRGLVLIEDDVFGFLPAERPLPLAAFAPERTIYVTSLSKSLAPGLRVGYLKAPAEHARALRAAVKLSSWMPPPLMAEIASRWIADGTADRLSDFQRREALARQATARAILPPGLVEADPGGFHLWLTLPPQWRAEMFRMEAQSRGVKVLVGGAFAVDGAESPNAVRLCLSHEASRARVEEGLVILAELVGDSGAAGANVL
ncbi:aminotransferase-like domain-containing protein [Afifella pfennigii]|uniref:aminotransferase-like domain-containing protein n=1 Tax=Afifella pfennigii TaxID=209897 RepID=UPI000557C612|nr:PLP-dependent aminotransferase family protein [Afifella pfennigii]